MKRIKKWLLLTVCLVLFPLQVKASRGRIDLSGTSSVVAGNRVSVTVTLSSNEAIGSWEMQLNYDRSYLELVGSTAENNGSYMVNVTQSASGVKSKSYTFTFRTLKAGSTRVSISSYDIYDNNMNQMNIQAGSKTIRIMTQQELEATYSKDNNLKSLSVEGYELDKEFNKDTLEYKVDVPTGTTKVKINATKNDNNASVSGAGEVEVTEGLNNIAITVTAQNGSEKTYTLIVNVKDQNPINVELNNKTYTVVKNKSLLESPITFEETTVMINDFEIPAFINIHANITLVGLKDDLGAIKLYQYKDKTYQEYNQLNTNDLLLVISTYDKELDFIKTSAKIDNNNYDVYKYSNNSDFVIISAIDLNTGKKGLYLYDLINKNTIRFDEEFINSSKETIKTYTNVIIILASTIGIMLFFMMMLIHRLRKSQKRIKKFVDKQEAKIEATRNLNSVVEEVKKIQEKEKVEEKKEESKKKNKKKKEEPEEIEVKEIQSTNEKLTKKEAEILEEKLEQTEEMYDLFEDDKKKKKK